MPPTFSDPFDYTGTPVDLDSADYLLATGKNWDLEYINPSIPSDGFWSPIHTSTHGFAYANTGSRNDRCAEEAILSPAADSYLATVEATFTYRDYGFDDALCLAELGIGGGGHGDGVAVRLWQNWQGATSGGADQINLYIGASAYIHAANFIPGEAYTVRIAVDATNVVFTINGAIYNSVAHGGTLGWDNPGIALSGGYTLGSDAPADVRGFTVTDFNYNPSPDISLLPATITLFTGGMQAFTADRSADWLLSDHLDPDPDGSHDGTSGTWLVDGAFSNAFGTVTVDVEKATATYQAPSTPGTYYLYVWDHADA